ncbi:MAG: pyridoxamine 5'-phosphate oxidase family protein [Pseudolysinimonas sp.]
MTMVHVLRTAFPLDPEESEGDLVDATVLNGPECWHLLGHSGVGRLAIVGGSGTEIAPVSYLTYAGCLYFRSAPGSALPQLSTESRVEVALDGESNAANWSVVVRGLARALASDQAVSRSGVQQSHAWQSGNKDNYFELRPDRITGRLVRSPA